MLPTRQNIFDHAKDLLCRSIQDDKKPSVSPETKFLIQKIADNKKKIISHFRLDLKSKRVGEFLQKSYNAITTTLFTNLSQSLEDRIEAVRRLNFTNVFPALCSKESSVIATHSAQHTLTSLGKQIANETIFLEYLQDLESTLEYRHSLLTEQDDLFDHIKRYFYSEVSGYSPQTIKTLTQKWSTTSSNDIAGYILESTISATRNYLAHNEVCYEPQILEKLYEYFNQKIGSHRSSFSIQTLKEAIDRIELPTALLVQKRNKFTGRGNKAMPPSKTSSTSAHSTKRNHLKEASCT
jgi:hypothetical protein